MDTPLHGKLYLSGNQRVARLQKKYAPNARQEIQIIRTSAPMDSPEKPRSMPTPWLADSEWLLSELTKTRETILRIPFRLDNQSDLQAALDRVWRLEQRLRFLLHLHRDGQRQFASKAAKAAVQKSKAASSPKIVRISA